MKHGTLMLALTLASCGGSVPYGSFVSGRDAEWFRVLTAEDAE